MKNVLAIIPARGGSKGLPRKNILDLGGKPLIAWTIEASLNSRFITKTIVSSDSSEILEVAKEYGADILKRPSEYATDTASSEDVVRHALESTSNIFDYLVLLQPTSPLRRVIDINNSIKKILKENATALISGYEVDSTVLEVFKEDSIGYIKGISGNKYPFMGRQSLPKTYMSNGAIYIVKVDDFLKNNSFITEKTIIFKMSKIKSLEIDTKADFEKIKKHIK
jgi:CMP-N,N'-diacetyllegionaminic acid synthase